MGPSEIKLLTGVLFLIQRLTTVLTCDCCPELSFGGGDITGSGTLYLLLKGRVTEGFPAPVE